MPQGRACTLPGMSLQHLEGTRYGPVSSRVSPEKVAEYVAATSDDPDRWVSHAPPSYAGALLFAIAPSFLWSDDVGEFSTVLVHSDQLFRWHGPLAIGDPVAVDARVARVRVRGSLNFVTLDLDVTGGDGSKLVESVSNFLMGAELAGDPPPEAAEPPVDARGANDRPMGIGDDLLALNKSASRADLVHYAAASGDFNPVHYDHDSARAAGLPGVAVHGLLMAAWLTQVAGATVARPDPLAEIKVRFRNPLLPGASAVVSGTWRGEPHRSAIAVTVEAGGEALVTGTAIVREA